MASLPAGSPASLRYAACDGGYMVFAVDPRVNPPSLVAVQELAVGMVRVAPGTLPVPSVPTDTLELWVDDIRLTGVVDEPGYAAYVGADLHFADFMDVRVSLSRRDQNFRQLAEQPTFNTQDALDVASTIQLGKLLPGRLGLSAPLTIAHRLQASDPYLLSRSDILAGGITGLRTPRTAATQYGLTLRRSTPLEGSIFAPLFNNLIVTSQYSTANTRSEYQRGTGDNFTASVDFNIAADPRASRIPGWLDRAVELLPDWLLRTPPLARFRETEFRYNPTQFRVTSAVAHARDDRTSFTTPAASAADVGRHVRGLSFVWRNTTAVDFQPVNALRLRWDVNSLRDLRDYGDTTAAGRAATGGRRGLFGSDMGLERERTMNASITLAPTFTRWLRPRASLASEFTMTRDPNAPSLIPTGPDDGRLPRRVNNIQSFEVGGDADLATLIQQYLGGIPGVMRGSEAFQPVSVGYVRTLRSSFDRAATMPPHSFQFALGDVDDFRFLDGQLATSAGVTNVFSLSNIVRLPLGLSLTNRFVRTDTRSWIRRLQDQHGVVDGSQREFPDLSLRWSWQPPAAITPILSSIGASAQLRRTTRSTLAPPLVAGGEIDRATGREVSYPLSISATWSFLGDLSTTGSYSLTSTEDLRPGSRISGGTHRYGATISRTFGPQRWLRLSKDLRATLAWQRNQTDNRVLSLATGRETRLTDNGNYTVSLSMDTEVSETSSFSLVGSRTVTFDENFNRRHTLTVLSAVMHLRFFGGNLR
jgi:hypothetical protein